MAINIRNSNNERFDLFGDEKYPITFQIADFSKITERNSNKSPSLNLPKTYRNLSLLGYPTDINISSSIRKNEKIAASIWDDESRLSKGYLVVSEIVDKITVTFYSNGAEWIVTGKLIS